MRSTRFFNVKNSYQTENVASIPGMRFIKNFFSENERIKMVILLNDLRKDLAAHSRDRHFTVSKKHNLPSEEKYKNVNLGNGRNCQFFPRYGEAGHELMYCIGNKNIPDFVNHQVISRLNDLDEIKVLQHQKQCALSSRAASPINTALDWNLTFNTYLPKDNKSNSIAGFPFHIDIASNGEITVICSFTSEADMEMRKKGETSASHSFKLTQGSLLLLSNESRWEWEHRLLKSENVDTRLSLVLGCR